MEGEVIKNADPHIGLLHRATELAESDLTISLLVIWMIRLCIYDVQ